MAEIPGGVRHKSHPSVLLPLSPACWLFWRSQGGFNLDAFNPSRISHDINIIFLSSLTQQDFFFFCVCLKVFIWSSPGEIISLLSCGICLWLLMALICQHLSCLKSEKKKKKKGIAAAYFLTIITKFPAVLRFQLMESLWNFDSVAPDYLMIQPNTITLHLECRRRIVARIFSPLMEHRDPIEM